MGLFNFFKKEPQDPLDVDYVAKAEAFEKTGDYVSAIAEYDKLVKYIYADKEPKHYRHITKKIIGCYQKLGDYDRVFEMWPQQYDPLDYGAKEMYELIKVLESVQKNDLVLKVYDLAGKKLARNKVDFLIKQKKIPEANALTSELLMSVPEGTPGLKDLWLIKAKLCLSLRKWEEAMKYLNKLIDKDPHNVEVRKLKDFCMKQVRMG
jgi:tetratricopeptide (TPR) repeat protein